MGGQYGGKDATSDMIVTVAESFIITLQLKYYPLDALIVESQRKIPFWVNVLYLKAWIEPVKGDKSGIAFT